MNSYRFTRMSSAIVDLRPNSSMSTFLFRASVGSTDARETRARCFGVVGPTRATRLSHSQFFRSRLMGATRIDHRVGGSGGCRRWRFRAPSVEPASGPSWLGCLSCLPSKELSQCSIPSITSGRLAVTARFHARSWVALASNALCVKRQGKPEVSGESVGHVESDRLVAPDESHDGGAGYAGFPL